MRSYTQWYVALHKDNNSYPPKSITTLWNIQKIQTNMQAFRSMQVWHSHRQSTHTSSVDASSAVTILLMNLSKAYLLAT